MFLHILDKSISLISKHHLEFLMCFFKGNANGFYFQFPPPLYGQAVVMDRGNDDFYTVGGTSGYNYFIDVHRINMREKVWESLFKANFDPGPNEPMPR